MGHSTFVPYETEVNFKLLGTSDAKLEIIRDVANYIAIINTSLNIVTLQFQYLPKAFLSQEIYLGKDIEFVQLNYRVWKSAPESFNKIVYPEQIKSLKLTEEHNLEVELIFDNPHIASNNTFLLFQHKHLPNYRFARHLNLKTKKATITFKDQITGKYQITIQTKFPSKEWHLGTLHLSTSNTSPKPPTEIKHTFSPELTYAPLFISLPVSLLLISMLLFYLITIYKLKIKNNNFPLTVYGKINGYMFIVMVNVILGITCIALCIINLLLV